MKKLLLTAILSVSTIFGASQAHAVTATNTNSYCINESSISNLELNETTLFYMYSNNEGMYFLDPNAEYENVIFVGHNDHKILPELKINTTELHHGKKFVGVFSESDLWELIGLYEVESNK